MVGNLLAATCLHCSFLYEVLLLQVLGKKWPLHSFQLYLTSRFTQRQRLNDSNWILILNSWEKESNWPHQVTCLSLVQLSVSCLHSLRRLQTGAGVMGFPPHSQGSSPVQRRREGNHGILQDMKLERSWPHGAYSLAGEKDIIQILVR